MTATQTAFEVGDRVRVRRTPEAVYLWIVGKEGAVARVLRDDRGVRFVVRFDGWMMELQFREDEIEKL